MKIKLTIFFIVVLTTLLAFSVSALTFIPEDYPFDIFDNSSVSYFESVSLFEDYGISILITTSDNGAQTYFFTVDYNILESYMSSNGYFSTNLDAIDFLGINPATTTNSLINQIRSSTNSISNLDIVLTNINRHFQLMAVLNSLDQTCSNLYSENYKLKEQLKTVKAEGYNEGYNEGYSLGNYEGYNEGYNLGYSEGETAGIETSEVAKTSILTVLSAPFYALSSIFNFEIFGINLLTVITTLITLAVIAFVLKKIKG